MITRVPINFNRYISPLDERESLRDFVRAMQTKRGRARFSSEEKPMQFGSLPRHPNTSRIYWGNCQPVLTPILTAQAMAAYDFVGLSSGNAVRASDFTYQSAIATPNAPTVANTTTAFGTPLTNGATSVKLTYQFPWGEGPPSAAGTATPTLAAGLLVSGTPLAPPSPAIWTNIYVETAAGSGVFKFYTTTNGESVIVVAYGNGAAIPVSGIAGSALTYSQYLFVQSFIGQSQSFKDANIALVAGYSQSNVINIFTDGAYYADLDTTYTWNVGDPFAPAANGGGTALQNQTLMSLGTGAGLNYYNSGLTQLATHGAIQAGAAQNFVIARMVTMRGQLQR